jgi:NADPH-dependent 2,4-dienoyl-CoA reductase/sulfur reductase-like enzyme/rhodanese-related sulfurtransferase
MSEKKKVVIVGGVAAGPKIAARVKRLQADYDVTVIQKGPELSFAGCGLPYYVGDVVHEEKDLTSTPVGVERTPGFFQKVKGFEVRLRSEAVKIDRAGKRVKVRSEENGAEAWVDYDVLALATGARPVVPPIPGIDLPNVHTLHSLHDAGVIRDLIGAKPGAKAVVIGGGLIGVETAEALVERGCEVTLVEFMPQILGMVDWEMARQVEMHMASKGVKVLTDTKAEAIEAGASGDAATVKTSAGDLECDLVVMGVGVRPNVDLAKAAGLEIGETGGIKVDKTLRTSDPDIYAAGDCVELTHLVSGAPVYVPLGSTANKQGRVVANNICGLVDTWPGVMATAVCKVFEFCVGRTGLSEAQARKAGHEVVTVLAPGPDKPHYMPNAKPILMKLIVDPHERKLLGMQAVGPGEADKRIDVAAMALAAGMTVDQLAKADLCYAPPYSGPMDNLITAADVARNKLDHNMVGLTPMEVHEKQQADEDFLFLDARSPQEYEELRLPGSTNIPLGALREKADALNPDQEIVAFCKVSLRGYEAARILIGKGFKNVKVLDGGVAMWPYAKETGKG